MLRDWLVHFGDCMVWVGLMACLVLILMYGRKRGNVECVVRRAENHLQIMFHMVIVLQRGVFKPGICHLVLGGNVLVLWGSKDSTVPSKDFRRWLDLIKVVVEDIGVAARSDPRIVLLSGHAYMCTSVIIVLGGVDY